MDLPVKDEADKVIGMAAHEQRHVPTQDPRPTTRGGSALTALRAHRDDGGDGTQEGGTFMQWDLGLRGLAVLSAISLGFGVDAGLLVGRGWTHRLWASAITTVGCFGVGVLTSEWLFGWATEEDLQPNVDGLSRDQVLLSSLLTTAAAGWWCATSPTETRGRPTSQGT